MKTPSELIDDTSRALGQIGDLSGAVHDYATMLGVLMAGPDAENAMAGMHRVALYIRLWPTSCEPVTTKHRRRCSG